MTSLYFTTQYNETELMSEEESALNTAEWEIHILKQKINGTK